MSATSSQRGRLDGAVHGFDAVSAGLAASVVHRRPRRRPAPRAPGGLRELRQGADGREPGRAGAFPRSGAPAVAALRRGAHRAVAGLYQPRATTRAPRRPRWRVPANSPVSPSRPVPRGALADPPAPGTTRRSQAMKALLDESPAASLYNNLGRRAAAPRRDAAGRARLLLQPGGGGRAAIRTTPSTWATRTGSGATRRRRSYWLREAVRRNPADGDAHYVLGVGAAGHGRAGGRRSARRNWRASCPRSTREWERRPATARPGAEGARATARGAGRPAPVARGYHARTRASARTRSRSRRSTSNAAGGCSSSSRIARRLEELNRALYSSPLPGGRAPAARPHPPARRPAARGDRGAQDLALEPGDRRRRTSRSARCTCRRRTSISRPPRRTRRSRSTRSLRATLKARVRGQALPTRVAEATRRPASR